MNKKNLLEDIAKDAQSNPEFFEEVLLHSGMSQRNLMQMYMLYKFKWNFSREAEQDLGWDKTIERWTDEGYAAFFAGAYTDNIVPTEMYQRMVGYDLKHRHKKFDT